MEWRRKKLIIFTILKADLPVDLLYKYIHCKDKKLA
jgi:hypothetical protein